MRQKNMLTRISLLIFLLHAPALFSQTFESLEDSFLVVTQLYQQRPATVNVNKVTQLIDEIDKYMQQKKMEPIEEFNLLYYTGYLKYIAGMIDKQKQARLTYLDQARERFQAAFKAYKEVVQLPEKKVFARFMQSWCHLRKYLLANKKNDFAELNAATEILDSITDDFAESESAFIKDDLNFLYGYCNYLMAMQPYKIKVVDMASLNQAIDSFSKAMHGSSDLNNLSKFYYAAARYLHSKLYAFQKLHPTVTVTVSRDSALADLVNSQKLFNQDLYPVKGFNEIAQIGHDLAFMQDHLFKRTEFKQGELLLDNNIAQYKPLLEDYAYFVNFLITGQDPGNAKGRTFQTERQFWTGVKSYLRYLSEPGFVARSISAIFQNTGAADWRSPYLVATANFYRKELQIIRNGVSNRKVDGAFLLPHHFNRNKYLDKYLQLRTSLQGVGYTITSLSSVKQLINLELESTLKPKYRQVFPIISEKDTLDIFHFTNYFLTLATKNSSLYPVAYLTYEYLKQINFNRQEMILLQAYCEYKIGQNQNYKAMLSLLNDVNIAKFNASIKNEAIYYRAMAYRKLDNLQYSSRVVQEMEKIKENHPYAGYGIAYEKDGRVTDQDLLNIVRTQSCNDPRFAELCEASTKKGGKLVDKVPKIIVGSPEVRFENLESLVARFVAQESDFMVNFWQAYSLPLLKPSPGGQTNQPCLVRGPLEFYLENKIEIKLTMGLKGNYKNVSLRSAAEGCTRFRTSRADTILEVLALRPYEIVVATDGNFPAIFEKTFKTNGEVVAVQYDAAVKIQDTLPPNHGPQFADLTVDIDADFYIASRNMTPGLQIFNKSNKAITNTDELFTAMSKLENTYYVVNRVSNQIRKFTNQRQKLDKLDKFDEKKWLNNPSDLACVDKYLFVVNSGNNTVVMHHVETGQTVSSKPISKDGKIEGIAAIGNKIFISDWQKNTIYVGGLDLTFAEMYGAEKARKEDMLTPGKISVYKEKYILVSDMLANQIFVFHKGGEFIGKFSNDKMLFPGAAHISEDDSKLLISQTNGYFVYPLVRDSNYAFVPDCTGRDKLLAVQSSGAGTSRFCNFTHE